MSLGNRYKRERNEIMIVTVDNVDAVVMGYNSNNTWFCIKDGTLRLRRFKGKKIFIKDPRIPKDWRVTIYHDWNEVPPGIDYGDYVDHMFICYPKSIEPNYLIELAYDNIDPEERTPFENYVTLKAMNEIREFHGLEKVDIPYIEEYELELMTPEQCRQKAIDDELEEYLRIGEELSKAK
jgi:hypothetical protein